LNSVRAAVQYSLGGQAGRTLPYTASLSPCPQHSLVPSSCHAIKSVASPSRMRFVIWSPPRRSLPDHGLKYPEMHYKSLYGLSALRTPSVIIIAATHLHILLLRLLSPRDDGCATCFTVVSAIRYVPIILSKSPMVAFITTAAKLRRLARQFPQRLSLEW
jgi:hypothetical protein